MTITVTAGAGGYHSPAGTHLAPGQSAALADDVAHVAMMRGWVTGTPSPTPRTLRMLADYRHTTGLLAAGQTVSVAQPLADYLIAVGFAIPVAQPANAAIALVTTQVSSGLPLTGGPNMQAVITLSGVPYTFDALTATDRGAYHGQFVHQRSWEARNPALPDFCVHFRQDTDALGNVLTGAGARDEVVIEYGRIRGRVNADVVDLLAGYSVVIKKNGAVVSGGYAGPNAVANGNITVPKHFYYARWRWQTAPRPFVRTYSDLVAAKLITPFDTALLAANGTTAAVPNSTNVFARTYNGIMSNAQMPQFLSGAGEDRVDFIGFVSGWGAEYLIFGTPVSQSSMMAEAEASASLAIHYRDENTGRMVSALTEVFCIDRSLTPPVTINLPKDSGGGGDPDYSFWSESHAPSICYAPFLLTDDPYYLEELEADATRAIAYGFSAANNLRVFDGNPNPWGVVSIEETRTWAWGMRTLLQLAKAAPATAPNWLMPQSYWATMVERNRAVVDAYMLPTNALALTRFKAFCRATTDAQFMHWYMLLAMSWGRWAGLLSSWDAEFQWLWDGSLPFVNGTSGWPRNWPSPYGYFYVNDPAIWNDTGVGTFATLLRSGTKPPADYNYDAATIADWAGMWAYFKATYNSPPPGSGLTAMSPPIDDSTWAGDPVIHQRGPAVGGALHAQIMLAALAMANRAGLAAVAEPYSWARTQAPAFALTRYDFLMQRYAVQGTAPDAFSTAVAALPANTWSDNLATNLYSNIIVTPSNGAAAFNAEYAHNAGANPADIPNPTSFFPFSYSSGAYVLDGGYKKYVHTGGGHDDGCGSEVGVLDIKALTWRLGDHGARLGNIAGSGGEAGLPYQCGDSNGWRTWRNAAGRFAPISAHRYSGTTYLPDLGKIWVDSGATFQHGNAASGGYHKIDVATDHWGPDSDALNSATIGLVEGSDAVTVYLDMVDPSGAPTGTKKLWRLISGGSYISPRLVDPVTGASEPAGRLGFAAAFNGLSCSFSAGGITGCVIPDPVYGLPFKAFVGYSSDALLCIVHKVNVTPNPNLDADYIPYGNAIPVPLNEANFGTRAAWRYMGFDRPGSTQIVVMLPGADVAGAGGGIDFYPLDTAGWMWGAKPTMSYQAGAPFKNFGNDGSSAIHRRCEYIPSDDAFINISGNDGRVYACKRPAGIV